MRDPYLAHPWDSPLLAFSLALDRVLANPKGGARCESTIFSAGDSFAQNDSVFLPGYAPLTQPAGLPLK